MRSLTGSYADLTTAQRAATRTPYLRLLFWNTPNYTYTTADATNRIKYVYNWEEPYGGGATLRLANYDGHFTALNLRGYKVDIGFGYNTASGNLYHNVRRVYVLYQRDLSMEGELQTEFTCIDDWAIMAASTVIAAGKKLSGTMVGLFTQLETVTGGTSNATGKVWGAGSNYIIVIGVTGTFSAGETVTGGTSGAQVTGITITAQSAAGGGGWNRDTTILQILTSITSGILTGITLDSDDPAATINTYSPLYATDIGERVRTIVRQLLQMSKCGARLENDDKLHILYLNTATAAQYSYDSDHAFFVDIRERGLIIPNTVIMVDNLPQVTGETYSYYGTDDDDSSVAAFGAITTIEVNPTIQSNAEALARATAWIAQRVAEANQGRIVAPMNCAQELYDMIEAVDTRANVTVTGRVGRIDHIYDPENGIYNIELRLGGLLERAGAFLPTPDAVEWDIRDISITTPKDPVVLRKVVYPWQLWKSVQPYVCDLTFSSVDKNHISWAAGSIKFKDGSSLTISAGTNVAIAAPGWLYFTEGSATLTYTTTFDDTVAPTHGLVAFVAPGLETGATALIIPAAGKAPLLNADVITCMTLSALTANCGTLTAGTIDGVTVKGGGGNVLIDYSGCHITGQYIDFYYGATKKGYIDGVAAGLLIAGSPDTGLQLLCARDLKIGNTSSSYGVSITAGKTAVAPTANALELYSNDYIGMNPEGGFYVDSAYLYISGTTIRPTDPAGLNLGSATNYYDTVHCVALNYKCPLPIIDNPLRKLRQMKEIDRLVTLEDVDKEHLGRITRRKVKKAGGSLTLPFEDKDSFPIEILDIPDEEDYKEADEAHNINLQRRQRLQDTMEAHIKELETEVNFERREHLVKDIDRIEKRLKEPMVKYEPATGVSASGQIWLLIKAVQELADKVEALEARLP